MPPEKAEEETNVAFIAKYYKPQRKKLQRGASKKKLWCIIDPTDETANSKVLTNPQPFRLEKKGTVFVERWILSKGQSGGYV